MASAAFITGAICPGPSPPDPCQPSWSPSASCTSGVPGPAKPGAHRAGIAGEAVDVLRRQARVGDGGERRLAGEVEVGAEEPPPDLRLADPGEDRAPLEPLLAAGPDRRGDRPRGGRRRRHRGA